MTENYKDIAVSFLKLAAGGSVREAYSKYVSAGFRHHNPNFEGSAKSLKAAMEENALQNPDKSLEVKCVIGEGDLVVVHALVQHKPGDQGVALVHIFRFERDLIVELWDIGQQIPEESPNQYGMF